MATAQNLAEPVEQSQIALVLSIHSAQQFPAKPVQVVLNAPTAPWRRI